MTKPKYPKRPPPPPMWLPTVTDASLARFRELPSIRELGLTDAEARKLANQMLRLKYLLGYFHEGIPPESAEERGERGITPAPEKGKTTKDAPL